MGGGKLPPQNAQLPPQKRGEIGGERESERERERERERGRGGRGREEERERERKRERGTIPNII